MASAHGRCRHSILRLAVLAVTLAWASAQAGEVTTLEAFLGNLEGPWRFATDPQEVGAAAGWQHPAFNDSDWRELRAPGVWEAQGVTEPRPGQPPAPKGTMPWSDYDGVAWYRRSVVIPAAWQGEVLVLQLGAVDDVDRAFVNGQLVGETGPGLPVPSAALRR